jgi:predicted enzyme related to lactoylglutathione lyase
MRRVVGLGGVFFKARDPEKLYAWYEKHLGLTRSGSDAVIFHHKGDESGATVWSIFPADTRYFDPSPAPFMINYRVEDLDALLEVLAAEGVPIDPKREEYEYGKFAWITDPEGNRIELWEPTVSAD